MVEPMYMTEEEWLKEKDMRDKHYNKPVNDAQVLIGLWGVIEPLKAHDRPLLRDKATDLKQTDGEGWAVGEMLERACILLDALEMQWK